MMNFVEATRLAKHNPGLPIREKRMQEGWKVVYLKWPKEGRNPGGGDFFCINPITGGDYKYTPSEHDKTSHDWRHA